MHSDEVANVVKLIQNCKYDKALSEAEKALYRATKELGRNHPDLVVYLDLLAGIYEAEGQYSKVKKIRRKALKIWMNAFLPKDSYKYFFADLLPFLFKRKPLQPRFFQKRSYA